MRNLPGHFLLLYQIAGSSKTARTSDAQDTVIHPLPLQNIATYGNIYNSQKFIPPVP